MTEEKLFDLTVSARMRLADRILDWSLGAPYSRVEHLTLKLAVARLERRLMRHAASAAPSLPRAWGAAASSAALQLDRHRQSIQAAVEARRRLATSRGWVLMQYVDRLRQSGVASDRAAVVQYLKDEDPDFSGLDQVGRNKRINSVVRALSRARRQKI